ncbi:MAG: protein kinase [Deltaproteobacteria bacterium]|nr:protein kinase [Deltaproteobacteria bacterium]
MRYIRQIIIAPWLLCLLLATLILSASLIEQPTLLKLEYPIYDQLLKYRSTTIEAQVILIAVNPDQQFNLEESPFTNKNISFITAKIRQLGAKSIALLTPPVDINKQHVAIQQIFMPVLETDEEKKPSKHLLSSNLLLVAAPLPAPQELLVNFQNPLASFRLDHPDKLNFQFSAASGSSSSGHVVFSPDVDGKIRRQALLLPWGNVLVPALPLQIVLKNRGKNLKDLKLTPPALSGTLDVNELAIPVHGYYRLALEQTKIQNLFLTYPLRDLLLDKLPKGILKDKIVLLGPTNSYGDRHLVAGYGFMDTSQLTALSTATLLNNSAPRRPSWAWLVETAVLIYFAVLLMFIIPRLSFRAGLATLLLFLSIWILIGAGSLIVFGVWLKIIPAALFWLCGFVVIRWHSNQRESVRHQQDNNRILVQRFKEQGLLDLALEKALLLKPINKSDKDALYNLGLEFERKRMPENAALTYRHLLNFGRFRDVKTRLQQLQSAGHKQQLNPRENTTIILNHVGEKPTLGRYRIEKELGQGAMGTVYLGVDPQINRQVAIKTLAYAQIEPAELVKTKERFFREAEAAGRLSHPNIVTIYDVGEENDLAFLAMELLAGQDLSHYCAPQTRLGVPQVVNIISQVAAALEYAHKHGVIHRDIKPANLILQHNGQIKVADFGIARVTSTSRTETGIILGTPSYMSPEQASGKKVDGRSDLFSLGVVMYELLSCSKPFQGDNITALLYNISTAKYSPLTDVQSKLPKPCYTIVDKLLQKTLTRRYKSAAALKQDIDALSKTLDRK